MSPSKSAVNSEEIDIGYDNYFGEDWDDEELFCPEGFTFEEDCGWPERLGIESCEFRCPWNFIKDYYNEQPYAIEAYDEYWKAREQEGSG